MIRTKTSFFKSLLSLIFIFFVLFGIDTIELGAAPVSKNDQLIEKISKDYAKKFCNSIGFGLSKDSAMIFTMKENNIIFQKKKDFKKLDQEEIANRISLSVIDGCGYTLNLRGEEGINEFKKYYISTRNNISREK